MEINSLFTETQIMTLLRIVNYIYPWEYMIIQETIF